MIPVYAGCRYSNCTLVGSLTVLITLVLLTYALSKSIRLLFNFYVQQNAATLTLQRL